MSQVHRDQVLAAANLIYAAAKTLDRVCRVDPVLHKEIEAVEHQEWLETIAAGLEAVAQQQSVLRKRHDRPA